MFLGLCLGLSAWLFLTALSPAPDRSAVAARTTAPRPAIEAADPAAAPAVSKTEPRVTTPVPPPAPVKKQAPAIKPQEIKNEKQPPEPEKDVAQPDTAPAIPAKAEIQPPPPSPKPALKPAPEAVAEPAPRPASKPEPAAADKPTPYPVKIGNWRVARQTDGCLATLAAAGFADITSLEKPESVGMFLFHSRTGTADDEEPDRFGFVAPGRGEMSAKLTTREGAYVRGINSSTGLPWPKLVREAVNDMDLDLTVCSLDGECQTHARTLDIADLEAASRFTYQCAHKDR